MAVGETFTAIAVEGGFDVQGWLQTAAAVMAPILAVFYVELRTVPRVQRTLALEEEQRARKLDEERERRELKRDQEQADRDRRLDEENAHRSADLHRQALAHSERVAAEQRRAQLLFEVRRDLDAVIEDMKALRFVVPADRGQELAMIGRFQSRVASALEIATILNLPKVLEVLEDIQPRVDRVLREMSLPEGERAAPGGSAPSLTSELREELELVGRGIIQAVDAVYAAVRHWAGAPPSSESHSDAAP